MCINQLLWIKLSVFLQYFTHLSLTISWALGKCSWLLKLETTCELQWPTCGTIYGPKLMMKNNNFAAAIFSIIMTHKSQIYEGWHVSFRWQKNWDDTFWQCIVYQIVNDGDHTTGNSAICTIYLDFSVMHNY